MNWRKLGDAVMVVGLVSFMLLLVGLLGMSAVALAERFELSPWAGLLGVAIFLFVVGWSAYRAQE